MDSKSRVRWRCSPRRAACTSHERCWPAKYGPESDFTCIAKVIEERREKGADAVVTQAPAASGTKILGRALLDGARGMIGSKDKETE